jgi:Peptidase family M23
MRVRLAALSALLVLAVPPAASGWTWPVDGPVLRAFSFGSDPYAAGQHRGIDIGAPSGTPVLATAGGFVSFAGTVPNGGKTVTIQTSTGYAVTLVHLGSIRVLRGTTVEEGATVGTVGPSGVPDIPEPYVYLGIRVASDEQGYLDPLLFLPPRAEPPAAPESAADPPSATAGASSGAEPAASPAAAEPPPTSPADASGEPPSDATDESATTQEPATEPMPTAGAEQPPATVPVTGEEPAAAAPPVAPASSTEAGSETAPATQAQGPAGGRAVLPADEPAAALGGSARAHWSPSAGAIAAEPSVTATLSVEPVEHHATPARATQPPRVQAAAATKPSSQGAVVQTSPAREPRPRRAGANELRGADAAERVRSRPRAATDSSGDDLWIAAALSTLLAAALAIRRHRRRPGATPAGTEAPRMMVLVGGLHHEVEARRVDRPTRIEHDERLAA